MTRPKRNTPSDPDSRRVYRGGCWFISDTARVRALHRVTNAPASRYVGLSFRTSLPGRMKR